MVQWFASAINSIWFFIVEAVLEQYGQKSKTIKKKLTKIKKHVFATDKLKQVTFLPVVSTSAK